ncbi:hypothetical protein AB3N58_06885 [Leptospira sp. WS60.C2]
MNLNVYEHGDLLETEYSNLLKTKLPSYNEIWSRYIGNDGKGNIPEIPSLSSKENQRRTDFSQKLYTILESLICLHEISQNSEYLKIANIKEHIQITNMQMAFFGHLGRIRDNMSKMGIMFDLPELSLPLEEFYQQRNTILHDKKIPFAIVDGELFIPQIKGKEENNSVWNDKKNWDDVSVMDLKEFNIILSEILDKMFNISNKCLYKILEKIIIEIRTNEYQLEKPQNHFPTASGTIENTSQSSFTQKNQNTKTYFKKA